VLVEPLFMSDPAEVALAAGARGQKLMARALAGALQRYLATGAKR
jgi:N-acetylmuramoyl-L-alanine amidase